MNKTKPKKFTFKNGKKQTGLSAIGAGSPHIKFYYAGVEVGYITFNDRWDSNRSLGVRIHLMVSKEITPEDKSPWKWGVLKRKFESSDEAKAYLNENFESISKMIFVREDL